MTSKSYTQKSKSVVILRQVRSKNIHGPDSLSLKRQIITDIESVLAGDVLKQINDTSSRYLLMVGNDDKAVLSACLAHSKTENEDFNYVNCLGDDLITFNGDIEKWFYLFNSGNTVFLRTLKSKDIKVCRQFARDIEESKIEKQVNGKGLFIISIDNICDLPEYLTLQFETIELIPQPETTTRQPTTDERLLDLADMAGNRKRESYDVLKTVRVPVPPDTEKTEVVEGPEPGFVDNEQQGGKVGHTIRQAKLNNVKPYEILPNAKLHDNVLILTDKESIKRTCKDLKPDSRHFSQMGFRDGNKKGSMPIQAWELLKAFVTTDNITIEPGARKRIETSYGKEETNYQVSQLTKENMIKLNKLDEINICKDNIKELNIRLRHLFQTNANPILPWSSSDGWILMIPTFNDSFGKEHLPDVEGKIQKLDERHAYSDDYESANAKNSITDSETLKQMKNHPDD